MDAEIVAYVAGLDLLTSSSSSRRTFGSARSKDEIATILRRATTLLDWHVRALLTPTFFFQCTVHCIVRFIILCLCAKAEGSGSAERGGCSAYGRAISRHQEKRSGSRGTQGSRDSRARRLQLCQCYVAPRHRWHCDLDWYVRGRYLNR